MKKWMWTAAAVALVGLAAGMVTYAQSAGGWTRGAEREGFRNARFEGQDGFDGASRMGGRLLAMLDNERVKTALGLTDDQTSKLRQIVVDAEKSTIKTRADLSVRRIELRELMRSDSPSEQAVMKKVDEISALRAQLMKDEVGALLSAKSVLTPEQQQKIRSFMENRRMRNHRRPGFSRQRTPPPAGAPGAGSAAPDPSPQQ